MRLRSSAALLTIALLSCAPQSLRGPGEAGQGEASTTARKAITVGYGRAVVHIGPFEGGVAEFREIAHAGLLALDPVNNRAVPRLAKEVPSTDHGTLVVLPDGRLQTRYELRPGILWHDGTPLSAHDLIFGYHVQADPSFPTRSNRTAGLLAAIEAPDDQTLVITWSSPTRLATRVFTNTIWAMPRHILGPLYRPGDVEAIINNPYWTREFVGLGAFKIRNWVEGSHVEFVAHDSYVLGRPKIDSIVWRFASDPNAGLASVLADDLDVTMGSLLDFELALIARAEWEARGKGTVVMTPANWRWVNLMPTNAFLSDIRVRRALLHALNREAISNDLFQGQQAVANIWVSPRRPQFPAVDAAISKYPFDPARAQQLLGEAGWRRGADGVLASVAGERFAIDGRVASAGEVLRVQQVTVDDWRRVGVQVDINNISPELDASPDYRNQWTGAYWASWNLVLEDLRNQLHTSVIPRPENRFSGGNRARWSNPRADVLLDQMTVVLDEDAWDRDLIDLARLWTAELPHLPLYYINEVITYARGITGISPRSETGSDNTVTWNVHEWQRG